MTTDALTTAIAEVRRFIERAQTLQSCRKPLTASERAEREHDIFSNTRYPHTESGCMESSAVRRASMDLTRALARLRHS